MTSPSSTATRRLTGGRRIGQREDRAAGAAGRDQGPVRPLPAPGKPWHRPRLQNLDDYDIVRIYGAEYRGVVNYYLLAQDVWRLGHPALERPDVHAEDPGRQAPAPPSPRWPPATRPRSSPATARRTCFEARRKREGKKDLVARFGGITPRQDRRAVIPDPAPVPVPAPHKELIHRLRKRRCELCEHGATVAVHQVASLNAPRQARTGPARVGSPHGENAAQDAHRLRRLP